MKNKSLKEIFEKEIINKYEIIEKINAFWDFLFFSLNIIFSNFFTLLLATIHIAVLSSGLIKTDNIDLIDHFIFQALGVSFITLVIIKHLFLFIFYLIPLSPFAKNTLNKFCNNKEYTFKVLKLLLLAEGINCLTLIPFYDSYYILISSPDLVFSVYGILPVWIIFYLFNKTAKFIKRKYR